jgi:hypothetical protein
MTFNNTFEPGRSALRLYRARKDCPVAGVEREHGRPLNEIVIRPQDDQPA